MSHERDSASFGIGTQRPVVMLARSNVLVLAWRFNNVSVDVAFTRKENGKAPLLNGYDQGMSFEWERIKCTVSRCEMTFDMIDAGLKGSR